MRELEIKQKEKTELQQKKQQQQESKILHEKTIYLHENHVLWEINTITGEVRRAEYNYKQDWIFDPKWKPGQPLKSQSALIKSPGCVYISALNKKSAINKFRSGRDGSKFKEKGSIKFF